MSLKAIEHCYCIISRITIPMISLKSIEQYNYILSIITIFGISLKFIEHCNCILSPLTILIKLLKSIEHYNGVLPSITILGISLKSMIIVISPFFRFLSMSTGHYSDALKALHAMYDVGAVIAGTSAGTTCQTANYMMRCKFSESFIHYSFYTLFLYSAN